MNKSSSVLYAELVAYPMEAWHPSIIGCAIWPMGHGVLLGCAMGHEALRYA